MAKRPLRPDGLLHFGGILSLVCRRDELVSGSTWTELHSSSRSGLFSQGGLSSGEFSVPTGSEISGVITLSNIESCNTFPVSCEMSLLDSELNMTK